jgi:c-di-GMP-binding flagellar brake protein YcgR
MTLTDDSRSGLPIIDISVGGVALLDEHSRAEFAKDAWFTDCALRLPDIGQINADLCVRYTLPLNQAHPEAGQRVGCAFGELNLDATALIQRYIYLVDAQTKHLRDD